MHHILLMGFLAGGVSNFFTDVQENSKNHLPFGDPPHPCRNYVCEYYLNDVIQHINTSNVHSTMRAVFVCPHCGFTYRRKGKLPKEKQYLGQIDIVDYGWKWTKMVTILLKNGTSPYKIARDFHCDVRTIFKFGTKHNILPPEACIARKPYIPKNSTHEKPDFDAKRTLYRQRWLTAIEKNPDITRNELRMLDSKANQWLHIHDIEWLEENSPPSKKDLPKWSECDDEYLGKVKNAIEQIRNSPDMPKRISILSVGRKAGIVKPHTRLVSDLLPKTKDFIAANTETLEQWQKRKILWVVQQIHKRGELLTVYKVRHIACIEDKERKLDDFIAECIKDNE